MDLNRNIRNFDNFFKGKSAVFPLKIRSSDGAECQQEHSNLICERRAVSDAIGTSKKIFKFPNVTFLPIQAAVVDRAESGNCDLGTTRLFKKRLDPVDEMPEEGFRKLSRTSYNLLMTRKADNADVLKEDRIIRAIRLTGMSGNKSGYIPVPTPLFVPENRGVKVKEVRSGLKEGTSNFQHIGCSKFTKYKQTSTERSTLDIGLLIAEKSISGPNHPPSSSKGYNNPTSSGKIMKSSGEIGIPWNDDVNRHFLAFPVAANSADNKPPSSSKTAKLRLDVCPSGAELPLAQSETTDRWIKRLKLISSNSTDSKTSKLSENLSHDKPWKILRSINKSSKSKDHVKEDETQTGVSDHVEKDDEVLLSHFWIKRFRRNRWKAGDEMNKKPFPSIAAMALVGRAMNGLESCELQKKGAITIWSTKAF